MVKLHFLVFFGFLVTVEKVEELLSLILNLNYFVYDLWIGTVYICNLFVSIRLF